MKKTHSILPIVNSIVLLFFLVLGWVYYSQQKKPKVVYINNTELFSNFGMVKDLNALYQKDLNKQKTVVDSLLFKLQNNTNDEPDEGLQKQFISQNNKLKEMSEYFSTMITKQAWSRINSYIKEYGKTKGYPLILGTQGDGNIMYADEGLNITNDFIQYANKKYEGK